MFNRSAKFVVSILAIHFSLAQGQIRYNTNPTPSFGGKVFVFFNGTANYAKSTPGNISNDRENLEQRVIDIINNAKASLDVAAYELNSLNIVVALCKARERGVRVRIIMDDEAAPHNNEELWKYVRTLLSYRYQVPWMTDAGWPIVKSKKNLYKARTAQMHNKFVVADYLSADTTDDVVLTGSYNFTITGMVSMQNVVQIQSAKATQIYTEEFENMWGSDTEQPDTTKAAFHQYKAALKTDPSIFGGKVSVYLAPMNKYKTRPNYLEMIADIITREAQHDIKICSFSFSTKIDVDEAIKEKAEERGVIVKAVFDKSLGKGNWSLYKSMIGDTSARAVWKKKAEAYLAYEDRQLHHKYLIIDAESPDTSDVPVVITGSFNFSKNANEANDDNFLVIRDRAIANQYLQEFYARFEAAKKLELSRKETNQTEKLITDDDE